MPLLASCSFFLFRWCHNRAASPCQNAMATASEAAAIVKLQTLTKQAPIPMPYMESLLSIFVTMGGYKDGTISIMRTMARSRKSTMPRGAFTVPRQRTTTVCPSSSPMTPTTGEDIIQRSGKSSNGHRLLYGIEDDFVFDGHGRRERRLNISRYTSCNLLHLLKI